MWPFRRSEKQSGQHPMPVLTELIPSRGLTDLRCNNAELRVWLPEAAKIALEETARHHEVTVAKYFRTFLVTYLYGAHELARMRATATGLYFIPPPQTPEEFREAMSGPMYSRASMIEVIPGLGKNIAPLKLFLPGRIKTDLQDVANNSGIPLSRFVREIIVSDVFGHTFWPQKLRTWTSDQEQIATDWEQNPASETIVCRSNDSTDQRYAYEALGRDRVVERLV